MVGEPETGPSVSDEKSGIKGEAIKAIGISWQMHGLVLVNRKQQVLRPSSSGVQPGRSLRRKSFRQSVKKSLQHL